MSSNQDEILVKKSQEGDRDAFALLVKKYQKRVYYMVFRYLRSHERSEEAIQKTFIDAWKYIHNFEGRSSFLTWLLRIAINNSKKDLLQAKKEPDVSLDDIEVMEPPGILEELAELERSALLASEIRQLTDRQQTILHLRVYEDLSFKQIGEVLGCSENTAKSHYHHIKNILKNSIKKVHQAYEEKTDINETENNEKASPENKGDKKNDK